MSKFPTLEKGGEGGFYNKNKGLFIICKISLIPSLLNWSLDTNIAGHGRVETSQNGALPRTPDTFLARPRKVSKRRAPRRKYHPPGRSARSVALNFGNSLRSDSPKFLTRPLGRRPEIFEGVTHRRIKTVEAIPLWLPCLYKVSHVSGTRCG
jgi:hypothetical protein